MIAVTPEDDGRAIDRYYMNERLIAVTRGISTSDRSLLHERAIDRYNIILFAFSQYSTCQQRRSLFVHSRVNRGDDQHRARAHHGPECLRLRTKRSSDAHPPSQSVLLTRTSITKRTFDAHPPSQGAPQTRALHQFHDMCSWSMGVRSMRAPAS